ncbi:MAG: outer membrane protein assembly factor BamB [Methyloversatilis sp.]|uniref:outer membrane protein assembly factor BamB n=1 Tax=Methyloversatilis sp. TaxID=2569862 RepID=UPI0025EEBDB0|nr:outer membrane protein assembly factor BamB [Methyloversatilis sp.]MCR6666801.1 outer membrane protein assembly factor BamB [Methyloversatilis sp.]
MKRASALLLVAALTGCSSLSLDSLNPFSGPSKPKVPPLGVIQPTAQLAEVWRFGAGKSDNFVFEPAVIGGTVYVASREGSVARIDDGRQIWKIDAGKKLSGGVGANERMLVVGTEKGEVLAFSTDGKPMWQGSVTSEVLSAPEVSDDMVFVRSADSRIQAFAAADGARKWNYQRANPALTLRTHAGLITTPSLVLAGFPGGKLVAINRTNGSAVWESNVALPKGSTELERIADVTSPPVIAGREVCAAAFQGRVACFELNSGNTVWTRDISSSAGIDIDTQNLYISDDKGAVHALDRATGASLWKQDKLAGRFPGKPLALEGFVAVSDVEGIVHLLQRENGAFAARLNGDGSAINAAMQPYGRAFIAQSRAGSVRALSAR